MTINHFSFVFVNVYHTNVLKLDKTLYMN